MNMLCKSQVVLVLLLIGWESDSEQGCEHSASLLFSTFYLVIPSFLRLTIKKSWESHFLSTPCRPLALHVLFSPRSPLPPPPPLFKHSTPLNRVVLLFKFDLGTHIVVWFVLIVSSPAGLVLKSLSRASAYAQTPSYTKLAYPDGVWPCKVSKE